MTSLRPEKLRNFGKGGFICSYSCAIGKSIPFGNRTPLMAVSASIKPNVGNGTQTSSFRIANLKAALAKKEGEDLQQSKLVRMMSSASSASN